MSLLLDFCLDPKYLCDLASRYNQQYSEAKPFPHIVFDDFLPESILQEVLDEFPNPCAIEWKEFDNASEKKLASTSELQFGSATRFLLYQLNSSVFIEFLEKLTGIVGIIPDPHFHGGGLHQIERGGFLKIHADFNRHKKLLLDRRLNVLIYLNRNWKEEYGGHFEMWDAEMASCEKKILPIFNRCVIFSTTDFSYHGHPEPLNCPAGRTRKSLALYYYSNGRPKEEVSSTHSTLFRERPEETFKSTDSRSFFQKFLESILPPILADLAQFLKRKISLSLHNK